MVQSSTSLSFFPVVYPKVHPQDLLSVEDLRRVEAVVSVAEVLEIRVTAHHRHFAADLQVPAQQVAEASVDTEEIITEGPEGIVTAPAQGLAPDPDRQAILPDPEVRRSLEVDRLIAVAPEEERAEGAEIIRHHR
jgi:hypothetical protein